MLIIVSNPISIKNEAAIINALFDEGMQLFHLRKPTATIEEAKALIEKIKLPYHHQIVLHQHHELSNEFTINRLHFNEKKREAISNDILTVLTNRNYFLSTSVHTIKDYQNIAAYFSYTFLGPVFNSISKPGYVATVTPDFVFPVATNYSKAIAIGGINIENILQAMQMNFNGVAVLGAIWQQPDKSIGQFKSLQKIWKQSGR